MIAAIDHINIVVADMARSEVFYGDLLGMKKSFEKMLEGAWIERVTGIAGMRAACAFFEFPGSSVRLELLQYLQPQCNGLAATSQPNTPGLRHFAFDVADIDGTVARLQHSGVHFISAPVEVPFAVNGKRKRLCYFHDPDGTLLEMAEYTALPAPDHAAGPASIGLGDIS